VTYVISEPCIGEKNGACVDVCPAACIHTTPEAPQNYIDPDVCIECEQCVVVCPVNAVFLDKDLPDEWQSYIQINADFFRAHKPPAEMGRQRAEQMVEAIRGYAQQVGTPVAAVVVNIRGERLASVRMHGAAERAFERADKKAYTALSFGVATHELRPSSKPLWLSREAIDSARVLMIGGGFPIVEGADSLGAVGVDGGGSPQQDILCCQAALGTRTQSHAI
jgi:ferredoxin